MGLILRTGRPFTARLRTIGLSVGLAFGAVADLRAQDVGGPPVQNGRAMTVRAGGVIEDSYYYHHLGPMRSAIEAGGIPQANGWYEYGFPTQSYRWGWFGAERNCPRVIWHDGYYGDCMRASYWGY